METTVSREKLIAFVKETHRLASETDVVERAKAGREISEATSKDYLRVGQSRVDLDDKSAGKLMSDVSRQSWDHHRAALRHETARLFSLHRTACDKAQRAQDLDAAVHHAKKARKALRAYHSVSQAQKPAERTKARQSKRKALPRGENWQQRAWEIATPAMRPALACGWAGARPNEIEQGVFIERIGHKGKTLIEVTIQGAKVTKKSGQPERTLWFSVESDIGKALFSAIPEGETQTTIKRGAKRINLDWSKRIRPMMGGKVSAYSLRHQFAANLKAANLDPVDIAKALGHLSIKSQSRYGSKQQGQSGGAGLSAVYASRDVITGPEAESISDYSVGDPFK